MKNDVVLECSAYDKVHTVTKVLNINQLTDYVHIHLRSEEIVNKVVYAVEMIHPISDTLQLNIDYRYAAECRPSWIDIKKSAVQTSPGLYIYAVRLVDTCTDDTSSLFFAYHMQNNNPETPYIYMNRHGESGCES